jgi:DNA topoisomerase-1
MDHKLYLSDPGIYRVNGDFFYRKNNEKVTNDKLLQKLQKIKVPPAWKNVWYASKPRCHIQVYGTDNNGKKQYILSEKWIRNAKSEKYNRMKQFIKDLGSFRKKIKLRELNLTRENIIHLLFNLLIDLHIRVGNEIYAEQNKTYGLTTLRQKHLKWKNSSFKLHFIGKSNIEHIIDIPQEYHPWFLKLQNENKNKPLFYYQKGDKIETISSEELNCYLKEHMGKEYTCKDFRTYSANMLFIKTFQLNCKNAISPRKIIMKCIDESANQLGHSRSISKKSYISNNLLDFCLDSFNQASTLSVNELLSKVWS